MSATLAAVESDFRKHFKEEMRAGRTVTPVDVVRWTYERINTGPDEAVEEKRGRGRPPKKGKKELLKDALEERGITELRRLAKGKVIGAYDMKKEVLVEALVALGVHPE